jgi:hypothetical protein
VNVGSLASPENWRRRGLCPSLGESTGSVGFCDSVHWAGRFGLASNCYGGGRRRGGLRDRLGFLSVPAVAHADSCVNGTVRRGGSDEDYFLCQDRGWLHVLPTLDGPTQPLPPTCVRFPTRTCARPMSLRPARSGQLRAVGIREDCKDGKCECGIGPIDEYEWVAVQAVGKDFTINRNFADGVRVPAVIACCRLPGSLPDRRILARQRLSALCQPGCLGPTCSARREHWEPGYRPDTLRPHL